MACGDRRLADGCAAVAEGRACAGLSVAAGAAAPLALNLPVGRPLGTRVAPGGGGACLQCRVSVRRECGNRKLSAAAAAAAAEERSQLAEKCWPVVLFIAGSEAASEASLTEE